MNFYDFHIGDYTSRTAHLEPMEDLAYRRLLDLYYVREEPLPHDYERLAKLIRLRGQEEVIESVLEEFFECDEQRGWVHAKCESVIQAAQEKRGKARESANKRWGNADGNQSDSDGNANAMRTHSEGNAPIPTTQSHSQKKTPIAPKGAEARFEKFWAAYPRKVGKDAALKAFTKRKPTDELLASMLASIAEQRKTEQWTRDGGQYIPHPSTWLNEGRWQDQVQADTPMTAEWHETRSGIERRAAELGIPAWSQTEQFQVYKARVMAAHAKGVH